MILFIKVFGFFIAFWLMIMMAMFFSVILLGFTEFWPVAVLVAGFWFFRQRGNRI